MTRLRFEVLGGRVGTVCTTRIQRPSLLRSIAVNLGLRAVNGPELIIDAGAAAGDDSKAAGGQRLESTWRSIGGSEPGVRGPGFGVRSSTSRVRRPSRRKLFPYRAVSGLGLVCSIKKQRVPPSAVRMGSNPRILVSKSPGLDRRATHVV